MGVLYQYLLLPSHTHQRPCPSCVLSCSELEFMRVCASPGTLPSLGQMVRIGALLGLGLAYAGSQRDDVQALLSPFASDTSATADMEVVSIAALALGLVYCGTCVRWMAPLCVYVPSLLSLPPHPTPPSITHPHVPVWPSKLYPRESPRARTCIRTLSSPCNVLCWCPLLSALLS